MSVTRREQGGYTHVDDDAGEGPAGVRAGNRPALDTTARWAAP